MTHHPAAGRPLTRDEAQHRADRIRACRDELAAAEADGALALTPEQRHALGAYHDALLASLSTQYDVDRTAEARQLSLGMRIVSFLGAVALTAAAVLFFQRIWGTLSTAIQVAIVWTAPLGALAAAAWAARREKTLYFTSLLALVAFGCFVLDIAVLGTIFNARPSPLPWLAEGIFALAIAYEWGLQVMLAAGVGCTIASVLVAVAVWTGHPWDAGFARPEVALIPALLTFAAAHHTGNVRRHGFSRVLRLAGALVFFVALLALTEAGSFSYLPFGPRAVQHTYQVVAFVVAIAGMWAGVTRRWNETLNASAAFFALLLVLRFVDWWWEWMPRYLFFLIVGGTAIGFLVALRRVRATVSGAHA